MKRTYSIVVLILVATSLFATGDQRPADRPNAVGVLSSAPAAVPFLTPPCADVIASLDDCPVTGCGELGDAALNTAKNRTGNPSTVKRLTLDEIRRMPQPSSWNTGADRASIRGPGREGAAVSVMGFLLKAKAEGKESCNCGLSHRADTDVHLVLVSKMPEAKTKEAIAEVEKDSVTAEITPRVRGKNEKWLYRNVNDLEGSYIRVTGYLMLDSKHFPQAQVLQGERLNRGLSRATNWEVHPITKLEVCTKSRDACESGKGWQNY
ncbi:MAG: hypothetical protein QOH71_4232 [Blastocatellia bacterium]|jgi:hypothetical protein|nr:hypothetical protein [Blastocatellia bacterium]